MTRYVFDTNVLVSVLLSNSSVPGQVFNRCLADGKILISDVLIDELSEVLGREKFRRYLTLEECDRFLEALIVESEVAEITEVIQVCRDPDDDHLLELAVNGNASFLVTGDRDLLALNPFRGISIITPAELWNSFPPAGNA